MLLATFNTQTQKWQLRAIVRRHSHLPQDQGTPKQKLLLAC